jgi:hypothetical protein
VCLKRFFNSPGNRALPAQALQQVGKTMGSFISKLILLTTVISIAGLPKAYSVELPSDNWNLNIFSYVYGEYSENPDSNGQDIALGETAIFVFGRLSDRLSILTEVSLLPKKYREDTVKVERITLQLDLTDKHRLVVGKMHTPVNYWNDSYHHGRYFFPTIDRPLAFKLFVPIHELGFRFSGSQLGKYNFFYDVVLSSGQSAKDRGFANGVASKTVAIGIKPTEHLEIRSSLYQDRIFNHLQDPGHKHPMAMPTTGTDLDWQLWSGSMHFENQTFEMLAELSSIRSASRNTSHSSYLFAGWKWSTRVNPFIFTDLLTVNSDETHFLPGKRRRFGIGIKAFISDQLDLKVDLSTYDFQGAVPQSRRSALRFQLSIGI